MKTSLICFLAVTFSASVLAQVTKLEPCDAVDLKLMKDSIADAGRDGIKNVKVMKNKAGQPVGFFAWNKQDEIHAEICESIDTPDITAASVWYYWENGNLKANPSSWVREGIYDLAQDEGMASMRLLRESRSGDVTVELTVKGMGEENFVDLRKDIVTFSKLK